MNDGAILSMMVQKNKPLDNAALLHTDGHDIQTHTCAVRK